MSTTHNELRTVIRLITGTSFADVPTHAQGDRRESGRRCRQVADVPRVVCTPPDADARRRTNSSISPAGTVSVYYHRIQAC